MVCGPGLYEPSREEKAWACQAALGALPNVLPSARWASTHHIWHDDLHAENIFVDPDDPATILDIIDWQSAFVAPLYDHTILPGYLDFDGEATKGLDRPSRPELPSAASDEEKATAWALYEQQTLVCAVKHLLKNNIESAFEALMYDESDDSYVVSSSRNLLKTGESVCLGALAERDDSLVKFNEAEQSTIVENTQRMLRSLHIMNVIKHSLGDLFPEKGVVRHDQYEDAKVALRKVKAQVLEDFAKSPEDRTAFEEAWPFDD